VVSVIEATLDNPSPVLAAQRSKARADAVARMKADGMEYEERMAQLESVTYPKPLEDLLEAAFEIYRSGHPWVADHPVEPKSVARDLYERAMTFADYIGHYTLARSEGLVLRYLTDTYRALNQTVPDEAKTDELRDLTAWLGELVRQVDSSLLDEWENLRHPAAVPARPALDDRPPPVTGNRRAFTVLVRNELFRRVTLASLRRYDELGELEAGAGWNADRWRQALAPYFTEHASIGTGPDARGPQMLTIDEDTAEWRVRQILEDPAGDHDWGISATVDLAASDEAGKAQVRVRDVSQL
jgi:hypothetical protein